MTSKFCLRIKETGALSQSLEITDLIAKLEEFLPGDALYQQVEYPDGRIEMKPIGRLIIRVTDGRQEEERLGTNQTREDTGESFGPSGESYPGRGLSEVSEEDAPGDAGRSETWEEPQEREALNGNVAVVPDTRGPAANPGGYRFWPEVQK
jgi:hypothetical protein